MADFSITTGTGDKGTTRLYSGEEVPKNDPRPSACGEVDELVVALGFGRLHSRDEGTRAILLDLQRELFTVGSEIATTAGKLHRLPKRIDAEALERLEVLRRELEARSVLPRGFVVPAATIAAAHLDQARCVARRLERAVVGLHQSGAISNDFLLVWLNRLSDYLFLLARSEEDEPILVKL